MSLPCCWPPSDEPPADPLRVDAGPADTVEVDTPLTLDGSATGGAPAYTFAWTQLSGPGTATFDDDTDPATDVSFDVEGVYVLQLVATDAADSVAGDVVTETVTDTPTFILDTLPQQPLWAHSLGVQLRTEQTNVFRVRRSQDDAELDITVNDLADVQAALLAFCGSGVGTVVRVYNAVLSGVPAFIDGPADPLDQVVVFSGDEGGAFIGATGFLCARPNADGIYSGALGASIVGDQPVAVAFDMSEPSLANHYLQVGGFVQLPVPGGAPNQWSMDMVLDPGTPGFIEVNSKVTLVNNSAWNNTPTNPSDAGTFVPAAHNYALISRDAGDTQADLKILWNGVDQSPPSGGDDLSAVPLLNADGVCWLNIYGGNDATDETRASHLFAFNVAVSAPTVAALVAWQATHYA